MRKSVIGGLAAMATACACGGETFLKVDINKGNSGVLQSGWSAFGSYGQNNVSGPKTNHFDVASAAFTGGLDVVIAAGTSPEGKTAICARDRDTAQVVGSDFPLAGLYRDWLNPANNNMDPLWVQIMGLRPGTAYRFTAYGYDDNNSNLVTVTPMAGKESVGESGTFSYTAGTEFSAETDLEFCATTLTAVTDAAGMLTFKLTGNPKAALLGGFTLAESNDKVFSLFLDFGDKSSDKVAAGARLFTFSESADPRSVTYVNQLFNGSSGQVTVTLTQGAGLEDKRFNVRDRDPVSATEFPGYQQYRDCAILLEGSAMWVDIDGLLPNARYAVTVCPYDYAHGGTSTVVNWTSGSAGVTRTFTTEANHELNAETPTDLYTASFRVRSDGEGRIRLLNSVASGEAAISWLQVDYLPLSSGLVFVVR